MADKNLFDAQFILEHGDEIKLSRAQAAKIESIMMAYQESTIRISAEIKILELRLVSFINSGKLDKKHKKQDIEKMAEHIRRISKQKTDWVVTYINYLLDLRQALRQEQLNILNQMSKNHPKNRGKWKRNQSDKRRNLHKNSAT